MLNFKKLEKGSSPFNFFVIDNFIDEEVYNRLQKQIRAMFLKFDESELGRVVPTERYNSSKKQGSNLIFGGKKDRESTMDIINASKKFDGPIKQFIDEIFKKDVQKKIYRILRPFNLFELNSIKPLKLHFDDKKIGFLDFILFNNCYVSAKLSAYTSNSGLFHHVDHPDKVNALLLYIGFSDGVQREGLGTQLYKVAKGQRKWSRKAGSTLDYYETEKLIRAKDIQPIPNRLFGFNKGKYSWHGVYPIELPDDVRRETIQINLYKHKNYTQKLDSLIVLARKIKNKIINQRPA